MVKIRVKVGKGRDYDILVGSDILKDTAKIIKSLNIGQSAFIITNPKIAEFYLPSLLKSLKEENFNIKIGMIPEGEKYKSFLSYKRLLRELIKYDKIAKRIFVINLGGGVIGDLGGFVAHTFKRGIDYVQIPTTLLACVDSGVGGKVGINFDNTKNIIGGFHQPRLVIADIDTLKTLPKRELKSALSEVIKYGVIYSKEFFEFLENNITEVFNFDKRVLQKIVVECYKIKAKIVEKDEFDKKNIRIILNYGHTIGHAVEAASNYSYRHGEAISIGIACVNDIAVKLKILDQKTADRIENLLKKVNLPVMIKNCQLADILYHLASDKKFIISKNKFVLIKKIGKTVIKENIDEKLIKEVIKKRMII